MNQKIEEFIQNKIFPELEKGRPNFDKPYTEGVVFHMKEIIKDNPLLNENILIMSAYAHDWGYSGLFVNGEALDYDRVKDSKLLHMQLGAEKVERLLDDEIFSYLTVGQKNRIRHLVFIHDKLCDLQDDDEIALMEADTLGGLDVSFVQPTFDPASNEKYMESVREKRFPKFRGNYAILKRDELYNVRMNYYKNNFSSKV